MPAKAANANVTIECFKKDSRALGVRLFGRNTFILIEGQVAPGATRVKNKSQNRPENREKLALRGSPAGKKAKIACAQ
jgi:hypothetical protein